MSREGSGGGIEVMGTNVTLFYDEQEEPMHPTTSKAKLILPSKFLQLTESNLKSFIANTGKI